MPDARTVEAGEIMRLLKATDGSTPDTCGALRRAAATAAAARKPLEPEALYRLGFANGYHVEMMWSPQVSLFVVIVLMAGLAGAALLLSI